MGEAEDKRRAEDALWDAIVERRAQIREAKLPFGERQHASLARAHAEGRLIDSLVEVMEAYADDPKPNEHNLKGMARTLKAGLPLWENILIQPGRPWSPYVTAKAKRGARLSIANATDYIRLL